MKAWFNKLIKRLKVTKYKPATYFCHIPKTAGTSFIVILDRFYSAKKIYPHQLWREAGSIDINENQSYDLYRGHFGGGGVSVLTDRDLEYLTILRDPVALAQSTYYFVKREKNTKVHGLVNSNNMSFSDFLTHPMTAPLVKNRMVRNISFDFREDSAAQEVFLSVETIEYLQGVISGNGTSLTDLERLNRSNVFIENCKWFGILERFEQSLQLLCYEMNWPPIGKTQKLNTFNTKETLSSQESKLLNQVNCEDIALYDYATELFDQRLKLMHENLRQFQTHEAQAVDDLLDIHYQYQQNKLGKDSLPNELDYGFDQPLLGTQWHRRELIQPENDYFRWTGPDAEASIDFWLKPLNYQVSIRIINAPSTEALNDLFIEINGNQVQWLTEDSGLVRVLKLKCPVDYINSNGLIRLKFICSQIQSHAEAFNTNDERLVGIAVQWIKFKHE